MTKMAERLIGIATYKVKSKRMTMDDAVAETVEDLREIAEDLSVMADNLGNSRKADAYMLLSDIVGDLLGSLGEEDEAVTEAG